MCEAKTTRPINVKIAQMIGKATAFPLRSMIILLVFDVNRSTFHEDFCIFIPTSDLDLWPFLSNLLHHSPMQGVTSPLNMNFLHCVPKNRAHILWPITSTNIDQYQCRLIELFVQHYLIICHKKYSHRRVPAATVAMATNTFSQTNVCAITARLPIVHVPTSSICVRAHLIWFLPTSGHLTAPT